MAIPRNLANIAPHVAGSSGGITGLTFNATQSASADANTLDDYEEGTWTPNQGAGLTVTGSFSSTGRYTKVGNVVTVWGIFSGSTSIASSAIGFICTNLPFANTGDIGTTGVAGGIWSNTSATFISVGATSSVYSVEAISATGSIAITHTYRV